ncbi:MAG TPA: hypothetical protein VKG26_04685 [Bacteroidia bacterium]|nr:hypothetical protein [Bacteroidia bacterium]
MNQQNEQLETIQEMRSLMERSSRFISLSGLSGVFAGIFALAGAAAAYYYLKLEISSADYYRAAYTSTGETNVSFYTFFFGNAVCVLVASLIAGSFFTIRKAKQKGQPIWDNTSKRLLINLFIPLAAGGIFCLVLLYHGLIGLIAPATLLFYGLALLNASKYTLHDIRYLGICQIVLGLIASFYIGYGLLFWAIGFGLLHILYGTVMYYKYER